MTRLLLPLINTKRKSNGITFLCAKFTIQTVIRNVAMTRFAKPDTIACPYCNHYHYRQVLCSFNTMWQTVYSDGGTSHGLSDVLMEEARCQGCGLIISHVQQLPALNIECNLPVWKRWFKHTMEITYLSRPSVDVYFELFERTNDPGKKMQYALKGYRLFNRTYRLQGQKSMTTEAQQSQHTQLANYIVHSPQYTSPEYQLLCADLHRQRGEFVRATELYQGISDAKYQHIVEQAVDWCEAKQTCLMVIEQVSQFDRQSS
jgi:hypothetical protein